MEKVRHSTQFQLSDEQYISLWYLMNSLIYQKSVQSLATDEAWPYAIKPNLTILLWRVCHTPSIPLSFHYELIYKINFTLFSLQYIMT